MPTIERIAHRFWSYPRWLEKQERDKQGPADVYHIVDHSYAHLADSLPANRVVITCHDVDAFRSLLVPEESESQLPHFLVKRVLAGFRSAAAIVCDSEATRSELVQHGVVPVERTSVVPIGVHPSCTPDSDAVAERSRRSSQVRSGRPTSFSVGSTIPRKQIDVLLEDRRSGCGDQPDVSFGVLAVRSPAEQAERARELGIENRNHGPAVHHESRAGVGLPARGAGAAALEPRRLRPAGDRSDGVRHSHHLLGSAGVA